MYLIKASYARRIILAEVRNGVEVGPRVSHDILADNQVVEVHQALCDGLWRDSEGTVYREFKSVNMTIEEFDARCRAQQSGGEATTENTKAAAPGSGSLPAE